MGGEATGGMGGTAAGTGGMPETPGYTVTPAVSWHNPSMKASVHFAPLDGVEDHVLAELGQATTSIRLAFFNIRLPEVRDLLIAKKNAGVTVEVVLDLDVQALSFNTMADELTQAGVNVILVDNDSASESTMHNKVAIVDGHLVMTGSANYSYTALNLSDEDLLTIDDATIAGRYATEIDELIAAGQAPSAPYPGTPAVEAWMGPEDDLETKAVALLDNAVSSAFLAMFQLNTSPIVDALLAAKQRGVNVIVVLDEKQATTPGEDADATLAAAGIPVVLALNTGNDVAEMHSKFLVVDHSEVLMGSANYTNLGVFFNDENMVALHDAHLAARFEGKLANLLDTYNAPAPSSLGLTTGMLPVDFSVSNVTLDPGAELVIVSEGGAFAMGEPLTGTSLSASLEAGSRIDYHYEIRHAGGALAVESGAHTFTGPYSPGPYAVVDAFQP